MDTKNMELKKEITTTRESGEQSGKSEGTNTKKGY
jgi:hypothetical protein